MVCRIMNGAVMQASMLVRLCTLFAFMTFAVTDCRFCRPSGSEAGLFDIWVVVEHNHWCSLALALVSMPLEDLPLKDLPLEASEVDRNPG